MNTAIYSFSLWFSSMESWGIILRVEKPLFENVTHVMHLRTSYSDRQKTFTAVFSVNWVPFTDISLRGNAHLVWSRRDGVMWKTCKVISLRFYVLIIGRVFFYWKGIFFYSFTCHNRWCKWTDLTLLCYGVPFLWMSAFWMWSKLRQTVRSTIQRRFRKRVLWCMYYAMTVLNIMNFETSIYDLHWKFMVS